MAEKKEKKRTFILGAGASKHAGGPLVEELLPEFGYVPEEEQDRQWVQRTEKALNLLTRHSITTGAMNFEQILTEIDIRRIALPPDSREVQGLDYARDLPVGTALQRCSPLRVKYSNDIQLFCRRLRDGDVIISFNYDILIEQGLWKARMWTIRYGYGFDALRYVSPDVVLRRGKSHPGSTVSSFIADSNEKGLVQVLKPHGSWNMHDFPEGSGAEAQSSGLLLVSADDFENVPHIPFPLDTQSVNRQGGGGEVHIAPSFIKSFARSHPVLRQVWHKAYERMRVSDEIWIIGYSIPDADTDAHLLVSAARADAAFHIVNPDAEAVAENLKRLVPDANPQLHVYEFERLDLLLCDLAENREGLSS